MPPTPAQKRLANALAALKTLQDTGKVVLRSSDLSRPHREILLANGFLRLVVKGWYMPSRPGEAAGDTTPWYAAMRDFIRGYCDNRFGEAWHVSADYSLVLHAGNTISPKQIVVHSPKAKNSLLSLPDGCSLLDYQAKDFVPQDRIEVIDGIRVLTLPLALIRVPESFFRTYANDAQIVLHRLQDVSELNRELLAGGHSVVAGRLAGALRAIGRAELADDMMATLRTAAYVIVETNPFAASTTQFAGARVNSPYVLRMRLMWERMRASVIEVFPAEPGLPADIETYMHAIEEVYRTDAYHSLSIEGYRVTDALIDRVATGQWDPAQHAADADARNAMAAHGYWLAHNAVKESIRKILTSANPGDVYRNDHGSWFRALFSPSVNARILTAADLAGYRSHQVYIKNAAHVPPPKEAVRDMMPELFSLLMHEPHAAVRAVLGHFMFVYIHPYMDGNGRIGRFLMNAMLASGGYPWTIVRVERRAEYMAALDAASSQGEIALFADFIASSMKTRVL
ncbi:MAG: Fic family protein [Pseudomonadota bacterium]